MSCHERIDLFCQSRKFELGQIGSVWPYLREEILSAGKVGERP